MLTLKRGCVSKLLEDCFSRLCSPDSIDFLKQPRPDVMVSGRGRYPGGYPYYKKERMSEGPIVDNLTPCPRGGHEGRTILVHEQQYDSEKEKERM
jgi:hypothetical protein